MFEHVSTLLILLLTSTRACDPQSTPGCVTLSIHRFSNLTPDNKCSKDVDKTYKNVTLAKVNCCVQEESGQYVKGLMYTPKEGHPQEYEIREFMEDDCFGTGSPTFGSYTCDGTCQSGRDYGDFDYTCNLETGGKGDGICKSVVSPSPGGGSASDSDDCVKGSAGCLEMISYKQSSETCDDNAVAMDSLHKIGTCTPAFKGGTGAIFTCDGDACKGVSFQKKDCSGDGVASPFVFTCDGTCQSILGLVRYKCVLGKAWSLGTIVGVSAGIVVLVGLLIVGGVFFVRKQKKKAAEEAGGYLSLDGSSSLIQ